MKKETLVTKTLEAYNMSYDKFAAHSGISKGTLENWHKREVSSLGEVTLNAFLKIKEQEVIISDFNTITSLLKKY